MARKRLGRRPWLVPALSALLATAFLACMLSPRNGQLITGMGATIGLVAFAQPGSVFTFEYAVHEYNGAGYTIAEWRPLGTCTAVGPIFTDVRGNQWQGCSIATPLPVSDCTKGGRGAWHANPADPGGPQRLAKVRTTRNGSQLFVFASTVTDDQLKASYDAVGGAQTALTYQNGNVAEVHVDLPTVGVGSFPDPAPATDVFVLGDRAYVGRVAGSGPEFGIFDIADSGNPQLLNAIEIGATIEKVAVEGDYAYLATDDPAGQLVIVTIADPATAAVVRRIALPGTEPASAIATVGGTVLVGRKNRGAQPEFEVWRPLDAAHPIDLIPGDTFDVGADVNAIDVTTGLFIPPGTYLDKTIAYLATSNTTAKIRALDVTDPAHVTGYGTYGVSGTFGMRDIEYHHGFVYAVSDDNTGPDVFILQIGGTDGRQLTLAASLALNTNNTGVAFYADKLLISTQTPEKAVTTVDLSTAPPAVATFTQGPTGAAALAVRQGVAVLATNNSAQVQLASPGLQLEPTLPWQNTVIGCLGDSNTAQGGPWCAGLSCFPFGCRQVDCTPPGTAGCELVPPASVETTVTCSNASTPTCPPGGTPFCAFSWCTRLQFCVAADPQAAPAYCAVEGRYWAPRPGWSTRNTGAGFATILSNPNNPADGPEQMAALIGQGATAFVIALGSADMLSTACTTPPSPSFSELVMGLDALRVQAGGAPVFYTVPPPSNETVAFPTCASCEVANGSYCFNRAMLQYRNRLFHELPPERIIDFHTGMVRSLSPGDYGDSVHLNASGQNKRARAALSKLAD